MIYVAPASQKPFPVAGFLLAISSSGLVVHFEELIGAESFSQRYAFLREFLQICKLCSTTTRAIFAFHGEIPETRCEHLELVSINSIIPTSIVEVVNSSLKVVFFMMQNPKEILGRFKI